MKITIKDVIILLNFDWETAKEKIPEIASEILSYYTRKWNEDETEEKIQHYIDLVWDNRLSSPTYPFSLHSWSDNWDKVKMWYVTSLFEKHKDSNLTFEML